MAGVFAVPSSNVTLTVRVTRRAWTFLTVGRDRRRSGRVGEGSQRCSEAPGPHLPPGAVRQTSGASPSATRPPAPRSAIDRDRMVA